MRCPALSKLRKTVEEVIRGNEVPMYWRVKTSDSCKVWCYAWSLALRVVLAVNKTTMEDATWMRKREDHNYINVAEWEASLKGVNLALKWGFKVVHILTDSAAVYNWVMSVIKGEKRVCTKGAAEMNIKRRPGTLRNLIEEFYLKIQVVWVPTDKKRGCVDDKKWQLKYLGKQLSVFDNSCTRHDMHHLGVDRTLYLTRRQDPLLRRMFVVL